jgi:hypothetical protein
MTAQVKPHEITDFKKPGAPYWIAKPFDPIDAVNNALASAGRLAEK